MSTSEALTSPSPIREMRSRVDHGTVIRDIRYPTHAGDVEAFLVEPQQAPVRGAVLFLHWLSGRPGGDRTQFLTEAIQLGRIGVMSLLPQGDFPWVTEPLAGQRDRGLLETELDRYSSGIDLLLNRPRLGRPAVAVVGHDFGAMYGALLAARDPRIGACVIINGTPRWSDWFLRFWPIKGDRFEYQRTLAALDPISSVGQSRGPLLFQFAKGDYFVASMTADEFHEAANEPKSLMRYPGGHELRSAVARRDRRFFLERELLGADEATSSTLGGR